MLLSDFLIEFWFVNFFEVVANIVGRFIYFYERSLRWNNKRLAWVLVEMDLDRGLRDSIN
jgi:hypothetical protein